MKQQKVDTIKKEEKRLFGFIRSRVASLEDAEDIFQEVLMQFIDGYGAIESVEKATKWLFRVAGNKVIDLYRYKNVRNNQMRISQYSIQEDGPLMVSDILPALGPSPEDVYIKNIIWEYLTKAIDELPADQREVFIYHELDGFSFKEMAVKLDKPINTLISRKRYAVLALREKLKELYNEIRL